MKEHEHKFSLGESINAFYKIRSGKRQELLSSLIGQKDRIRVALSETLHVPIPDVYLYYHPDDIATIWEGEQDNLDKKGPLYDLIKRHAGTGLFTMENGEDWRNHQRIIGPAFNRIDDNRLQEKVEASTKKALAHDFIGIQNGAIKNPHKLIKTISMQVNADFTLGASINTSEAMELAEAFTTIHDFTDNNVRNLWLPELLDRIYTATQPELHKAQDKVDNYAVSIMENNDRPGPLLEALQRAKAAFSLNDEEIKNEIITILAAGHGTIASAVTSCLHLLSSKENKQVQDAIREEVTQPSFKTDVKDTLLTSTFQEAMRLYPPIYVTFRQTDKNINAGNNRGSINIPKGSIIAISPYLTHRHPDFWTDPEVFQADRFLKERKPDRNAYIPFGAGRRKCIGEHWAMELGPAILADLLQKYEFSTDTPLEPRFAATLRPTKDLKLFAKDV